MVSRIRGRELVRVENMGGGWDLVVVVLEMHILLLWFNNGDIKG